MKRSKIELECPFCGHHQDNEIVEGDKFAWQCKNCKVVIEDGKAHALLKEARFILKRGGNVCTGFGGLYGEADVNREPGTIFRYYYL